MQTRTHAQTHTRTRKIRARKHMHRRKQFAHASVWLTDKQFEGTHVHARSKHVQKHTFISQRLLFCVFPSSQTSKGEYRLTDKQQYYNPRHSTMPFSNAPPLTTCGMGWREGGFKQTWIHNKYHLQPIKYAWQRTSTFKLTTVRINNAHGRQWLFSTGVHLRVYIFYSTHVLFLRVRMFACLCSQTQRCSIM